MRYAVLITSFFLFTSINFAQTGPESECQKFLTGRYELDLSPSVCSVVVKQLALAEHFISITESGELEAEADGIHHVYHLPLSLMSALILQSDTETQIRFMQTVKQNPQNVGFDQLGAQGVDHWEYLRDRYCSLNAGSTYSDLEGNQQSCTGGVDKSTNSPKLISGSTVESTHTFPIPSSIQGTRACKKAITFAIAEHSGLSYRLPNISKKWFDKVQRKNPAICFTQYGTHSGEENYLVVLSSTSSAYKGLQPVFHRSTTINPVSGSGTLTDNTGGTWDFTYQGTITTTATTETNVPYTDTTNFFYANAYRADGSLIATSERSESARQGGDPYNSAGYNLTSALLSIHLKGHLLDEVVKKISASP